MSDTRFQLTKNSFGQYVAFRELADGQQESHSLDALEYIKWLADGNEPLPAKENA